MCETRTKSPIHEKLLSGFEKMEFEFVDGLPIMPSFVANPTTRPLIEKALQHIFETPDLNRRFRAIMDEKRERHRDREAARKLVE